jgi:hypothetical protein
MRTGVIWLCNEDVVATDYAKDSRRKFVEFLRPVVPNHVRRQRLYQSVTFRCCPVTARPEGTAGNERGVGGNRKESDHS